MIVVNFFEALIIASIFYNLPESTSSFFMRGGVLFMMVLLNAFGSLLEIMSLYAKRQIVEKASHCSICTHQHHADLNHSTIATRSTIQAQKLWPQ